MIVIPGVGGLAVYSPLVDKHRNAVRAVRAALALKNRYVQCLHGMHVNMFANSL
jgi:glutaminase